MTSMAKSGRIIWVDCEMTGLDVNCKTIVEIACVVTEADLKIVDKGLDLVISQPNDVIEEMDDWCKRTFTANGLLNKIQFSDLSIKQAENEVLNYVQRHTEPGVCPLAGNSVGHDRVFLQKYMPEFSKHLHYRNIDVSTIKELAKRWYPDVFALLPQKKLTHRALDDIYESIEELSWYRKHIFNPGF